MARGGFFKLQFKFVHSKICMHQQILTSVRLSELLAENTPKIIWLAATAVFSKRCSLIRRLTQPSQWTAGYSWRRRLHESDETGLDLSLPQTLPWVQKYVQHVTFSLSGREISWPALLKHRCGPTWDCVDEESPTKWPLLWQCKSQLTKVWETLQSRLWTAGFSALLLKDPQGIRALLKLFTLFVSKTQNDVKGQLFFLSSLKVMSLLSSTRGSVFIQSSQGNFWVERIYRHDTLLAYFTNNALISQSAACKSMCLSVSGHTRIQIRSRPL